MRKKFRNDFIKKLIYSEETIHKAIQVPVEVYYEDANLNPEMKSYFYLVVDGNFIPNCLIFYAPVEEDDQVLIAKKMVESFKEICDFSELDEEEKGSLCPDYELDSCSECLKYQSGECLGPMYTIPSGCYEWNISDTIIEKYKNEKYQEFLLNKIDGLISRIAYTNKETINSVLEKVDIYLK